MAPSIASGWEDIPSALTPSPPLMIEPEPLTRRERPPAIVTGTPLVEPAPEAPSRVDVRAAAPWVLLGVFLLGGTCYHRYTVHRLEEMIERAGRGGAGGGPKATFAGRLVAREPMSVDAAIAAPVKKVLVTRGQQVKKNAVLVELEDGKVRAELSDAMSRAREATKQRMKLASRTPAHASQADLDEATQRAEAAGAETRALQETLEQYKVRSPMDGMVLDLIVKAGDNAQGRGSPLLMVADPGQVIAEVTVPPEVAATLTVGQHAELSSEAVPGRALPGAVLDVNAKTGAVHVQLNAHEPLLRPAQTINVTFGEPGS
jgi:multidrug resistance efflux pump